VLQHPAAKQSVNQQEIEAMIDTLVGVAWGLYGHIAAHELVPGTIDGRVLGCKAQVSETREGK